MQRQKEGFTQAWQARVMQHQALIKGLEVELREMLEDHYGQASCMAMMRFGTYLLSVTFDTETHVAAQDSIMLIQLGKAMDRIKTFAHSDSESKYLQASLAQSLISLSCIDFQTDMTKQMDSITRQAFHVHSSVDEVETPIG